MALTALLQQAVITNDFGLRRTYPWSDRRGEDPEAIIDTGNISPGELTFLSDTLGSQIPNIEDAFVGRIENPYLWSRYVLQYEQMRADSISSGVKERIVIHATSISGAYEIAENNFDWRLVNRYRYGRGVSFAKNVDYSARQATQSEAYIIAGILMSTSALGNYGTRVPPDNYDTTRNHMKTVYVKYNDNDFYPYYIVH